MKFFFAAVVGLAILPAVLTGCSSDAPKPVPVPPPGLESFKADLGNVAKTGEGGSGLESLRFAFEEIKKVDAAKATAVDPDFQLLLKANTPDQRKALATKILQKL